MSAEFIATAALRATLLLALGLAALRWLPVNRPRLRRSVAFFCLATSLVLPFLPRLSWRSVELLPKPWPFAGEAKLPVEALAMAWALGVLFAAIPWMLRLVALRRWLKTCVPMPLSISAAPRIPVRVCAQASAPCVAGFMRPVLIVPEKAKAWDEVTWRCVLAHELQHVHQGDLWLGWIAHAVRVMHWWNPLAWKLSRNAGLECEACCDDAVLRLGVKAADYARVLLGFTSLEAPASATGWFIHGRAPSSLRLRMERLLAVTSPRVSAWRLVAVAGLLSIGMAGCLWFAFEKVSTTDSGLSREAEQRWQANPFPGDQP